MPYRELKVQCFKLLSKLHCTAYITLSKYLGRLQDVYQEATLDSLLAP